MYFSYGQQTCLDCESGSSSVFNSLCGFLENSSFILLYLCEIKFVSIGYLKNLNIINYLSRCCLLCSTQSVGCSFMTLSNKDQQMLRNFDIFKSPLNASTRSCSRLFERNDVVISIHSFLKLKNYYLYINKRNVFHA